MLAHPQTPFSPGQMERDTIWQHPVGQPPMPPAPPILSVMNQFPGNYAAFDIKPLKLGDGQYSWDDATHYPLLLSDAKLGELVRKDVNKGKVEDVYKNNKNLNSTRRQHIDRVLLDLNRSEVNTGMIWKLASLKLTKEIHQIKKANGIAIKPNITSIRVILKRARLSVSTPAQYHGLSSPRVEFQLPEPYPAPVFGDPYSPRSPAPILHQDYRDHSSAGGLFGETMNPPMPLHQPPGMVRLDLPGDVPEEYFGEDKHQHNGYTKHGSRSKGKDRHRSKPIDIYVPNIPSHARHSSKHSSRPTSWAGSDAASLFESPLTSVSNSPHTGVLHDSKHHGRLYRGDRGHGSESAGRYRSKDDFVLVPNTRRHKHNRSANSDDNFGAGSSNYHYREPERHDDVALATRIERLQLDEYGRKVQELQQRQRDVEIIGRLDEIESRLQQNSREVVTQDRPRYNRRYSDNYDLGYSSVARRRHGDRYM